jgi:hypothetical protein
VIAFTAKLADGVAAKVKQLDLAKVIFKKCQILILKNFQISKFFFSNFNFKKIFKCYHPLPRQRGLVVTFPPATEKTGAMGRKIESRQGVGW